MNMIIQEIKQKITLLHICRNVSGGRGGII